MRYTIAIGNPFDGVKLWGTFASAEAANEWADGERWDDGWYVVPVENSDDSIDDGAALDRIAALLSGTEWDVDTLLSIRDVLLATGREVAELQS